MVSKLTLHTKQTVTLINNSQWYFHANKRKHIWESNRNIFPNRDVILYSFGTDSNITYSMKGLKSDNSGIYDILKSLNIFLLASIHW